MPVLRHPERPTHELGSTRFTSLATPTRGSAETSLWRVHIAPQTPGTPHQVSREEIFHVLAGRAAVRIGEDRAMAGPGDTILVPARTTFAIANSDDEALELLCCFPVGGEAILEDGTAFTPPWAR